MKGRNCWNVNFTICWQSLLPFRACVSHCVCICVFSFFLPFFLIPCSSVLFHECAAILAVWSHGVSVSVALTGWKIQCHMVDGGDFPISFLFRALSPSGNPFFYYFYINITPKVPVTSPCPPPEHTVAFRPVLLELALCLFLLGMLIFWDPFGVFILTVMILITRLQDPKHFLDTHLFIFFSFFALKTHISSFQKYSHPWHFNNFLVCYNHKI